MSKTNILLAAMTSVGLASVAFSGAVNAADAPKKYNIYCVTCHESGVAGAPKTGDKEAWAAREKLVGGIDALVASSKAGKGAMPKNGLCADCSDADLKQLIQFMSGTNTK